MKRSKRRSASSGTSKPPDERVFFVDRSLGRHALARRLRDAGLKVEVHDDHFPPDTADEDWLREVGRRGWVVLTTDKRIRSRALERAALLEAKVQTIFLPSKNFRPDEIGIAIAKSVRRFLRFLDANPPPLLARMGRDGRCEILERRRRKLHRLERGPHQR